MKAPLFRYPFIARDVLSGFVRAILQLEQACSKVFPLLFFLLCGGAAGAQTTFPNFAPKLTPLAPETALLGVYGNTPLDLNAGAANVSVPLAVVRDGPLEVPVSLAYRSTGITVNEMASWVGLGWVLNGGGVITRSVHGLPDFTHSTTTAFAYGWGRWQARHTLSAADQDALRGQIAAGQFDTEPDVYNVSLGGRSAKVVFDTAGVAHIQPYAAWQVTFTPATGWTIVTEEGTRYAFTQTETTQSPDQGPADAVITAWYLNTITSADGAHAIAFRYHVAPPHRVNSPDKQEQVKLYGINGALCRGREQTDAHCCPDDPTFAEYTPRQFSDMQTLYLEHISSATASVHFFSSLNRADAGAAGDPAARRLDSVQVHDEATGNLRQRFVLTHGYFGNTASVDPLTRRLKLAAVQEIGKPSYVFTYNELTGLPPRNSYSQDHWGYANGAANTTLIPRVSQRIRSFYVGAETLAERGSNEAAMKGWALTRVTYPTGGHTSFAYEANVVTTDRLQDFGEAISAVSTGAEVYVSADTAQTAANMDELDRAVRSVLYVQRDEGNGVVPYVDATVLDLPYGAQVTQVVQETRRPTGSTTFPQRYFETLLIRLNVAGTVTPQDITPQTVTRSLVQCFGDASVASGNGGCAYLSQLTPGKYLLVAAAHEPDSRATLALSLILNPAPGGTAAPFVDRVVGGLHLRQTVDASGRGDSLVKTFTYTRYDSVQRRLVSTGRLFTEPRYAEATACGNILVAAHDLNYIGFLTSGYHIGYDRVTTQIQGGFGGSVETNYLNEGDVALRSLVRREVSRHADGTIAQITEYDHELLPDLGSVEGIAIKPFRLHHTFQGNGSGGHWAFNFQVDYTENSYAHISAWNRLLGERHLIYPTGLNSSGLPFARRVRYTYPSRQGTAEPLHTQPIVTRTFSEDGTVCSTSRRFAIEYNAADAVINAAAQGIRGLQQAHVLTAVIEKTDWLTRGRDSTITGGQLTDYAALRPQRLAQLRLATPLPASQFTASSLRNGALIYDPRYATTSTYDRYDRHSNLLELRRQNDRPTAYLWGYQADQPIAEARDAKYTQLAYTSFEPSSTGRWCYDTTNVAARILGGRTGQWAYVLINGRRITSPALPAGTYEVLFWSTGAVSLQVNGVVTTGQAVVASAANWQQHRARVVVPVDGVVTLLSASGSVLLDEVRLHPVGTQMTSYTHAPLVGMTSQTDPSGRTMTYEYDALGRLLRTRDEQGRIVSQQQYHYAQD